MRSSVTLSREPFRTAASQFAFVNAILARGASIGEVLESLAGLKVKDEAPSSELRAAA